MTTSFKEQQVLKNNIFKIKLKIQIFREQISTIFTGSLLITREALQIFLDRLHWISVVS